MSHPGAVEDVFPLTPMQQGILLHSVAEPGLGVYVNQVLVRLTGPLRPDRLRSCWSRVVRRHGILRAAFLWEGLDHQVQAVRPEAEPPWDVLDWTGVAETDREGKLAGHLAADRATPFVLSMAPLMRLVLIRLDDQDWWLVWTHHHLLLDGWSMTQVLGEVFDRYRAGPDEPPPSEPVPYREYVEWLRGQDFTEAETYWRQQLAGFAEPTPLPGARIAGSSEAAAAEVTLSLSADELAGLREVCRTHRLTLGTVVQGAWALLVHRYTGHHDVVFGSVVSGRPADLPGVAGMVGLFTNTLPVRARIDEAATTVDWLTALQADLAEARRFEYSPLADVHRWSDMPVRTALFDAIVAFENYPVETGWLSDEGAPRVVDLRFHERPHYPLTLAASATDRLHLRLIVDRRRYDDGVAERILGHLRTLLAGIAAQPAAAVGELPMLTAAETGQILESWAHGEQTEPLGRTLPEVFEARLRQAPDAVAIVHAGAETTYRQFAARVHRLARYLRDRGVRPDVPVAVCLNRSPDLVVAVFAVMYAGGAAVPIDPDQPGARIAKLLRGSGSGVLIAARDTLALMTDTAGHDVVALDDTEVRAAIAGMPAEPPPLTLDPGNLMYIIHTSGSTGSPKGVMATYRGVLNHLGWLQAHYPIGPGDRVAQRCSQGFDISVWELYWPLLTGAALLVLDADPADPEAVAAEMSEGGATVVSYAPSMLDAALADATRRFPPGVRIVHIGGEALARTTVEALRQVSDAGGINGYGPTETTVASVAWPLPVDSGALPDQIPIGRPVGNTRGYVLDSALRPVPAGVLGELYTGGAGVTRGYLGQPGATADRFVPDPFDPAGGRLYRTGDLIRWRPDGLLEFAGRADFQIKVRGFRIEPGEIEAALLAQPSVRQAVVVARDDGGGQRLVAYLVPTDAQESVSALRTALSARLPDYMIPSVLVWLEALPVAPSGKVDRRALPAPDRLRPQLRQQYVAPGDDTERTLATIWSTVLGVDRIGVHDSFFELGGDSIMMLLVVSQASRAGLRITPRQFFDHPTVAELAAVAERVASPVGIATGDGATGRTGVVPMTPVQRWFFEQELPRQDQWNLGMCFAVETDIPPWQVVSALRRVVDAMIVGHEALRTRFRREQSGWVAEVLPATQVTADDVVCLVSVADEPDWRQAWTSATAQIGRFDLDRAPLLRVVLVDGGRPDRLRLVLTAHHLVIDGVSWRVLLEDLAVGYPQAVSGGPVVLPAPGTPASGWAAALERLATTSDVERDIGIWRAQRVDDDTPLLVQDDPGPAREADVGHIEVALPEMLTTKLLREVPEAYRTHIDDALLTALVRALAARTERREFVIALEGHGREQHLVHGADLARTVGWLTSIAPVRLALSGGDIGTALKSVKEQLRAIPHRGVTYGLLRYLNEDVRGELAALPQPSLSFNYLGQFDAAAGSGGEAGLRLSAAPEPPPPAHHPDNHRPYPLEVTGMTAGGQLRLTFSYGTRHHRHDSVAGLADETITQLTALIEHCVSVRRGGFTPSDFPEAGLGQQQLDALLAGIDSA